METPLLRGFHFLWLGNKADSRYRARPCGASVANAPLLLHSLTAARLFGTVTFGHPCLPRHLYFSATVPDVALTPYIPVGRLYFVLVPHPFRADAEMQHRSKLLLAIL